MVKQGIYNAKIKGNPYFLCCRHAGDILYAVLRYFAKKRGLSVSFLRTLTDSELFEVADYNLSMELMDVIIHDKKVIDNEED